MATIELSSEDRRQAILALSIAIAQESKVIHSLETDTEFRSLRGPIAERYRQLQTFMKLLVKLQGKSAK